MEVGGEGGRPEGRRKRGEEGGREEEKKRNIKFG